MAGHKPKSTSKNRQLSFPTRNLVVLYRLKLQREFKKDSVRVTTNCTELSEPAFHTLKTPTARILKVKDLLDIQDLEGGLRLYPRYYKRFGYRPQGMSQHAKH